MREGRSFLTHFDAICFGFSQGELTDQPFSSFLSSYLNMTGYLKCTIVVVWRNSEGLKCQPIPGVFWWKVSFSRCLWCWALWCQDFTEKRSGRCKLAVTDPFNSACFWSMTTTFTPKCLFPTRPASRKDILSISSHHFTLQIKIVVLNYITVIKSAHGANPEQPCQD